MIDVFHSFIKKNIENRFSEKAKKEREFLAPWEILKFQDTIHFMPYAGSFLDIIDIYGLPHDNIIFHQSVKPGHGCEMNVLTMNDIDESPEKIKSGILWMPYASETMKCWKKRESKFYDALEKANVHTIYMLG